MAEAGLIPAQRRKGVEFYTVTMSDSVKLSHTAALILQTVDQGFRYGFDIMDTTGLPSGTVYPALRRLEAEGLIDSKWEAEKEALAEQRPARKYYRLTRSGAQVLLQSQKRYPLLEKLTATKPRD
jgi:PadR family transcriptional regulator, regulatory protein PadR